MSVIVYTESAGGKFKKSTLEAVSYAKAVADGIGGSLTAISIGEVSDDELSKLGAYGAEKVLNVSDSNFNSFTSKAYTKAISEAAANEGAKVVVMSNSFTAKGLAPRVAVRMNAGLVDGAISLPDTANGFVVRTGAYSGKAFADVSISSDAKVITVSPNAYEVKEVGGSASVEAFSPSTDDSDFAEKTTETVRATDKILLPEAELVVSAGRGLKGPENWGMVEELAELLGAATACSKPVSDADWRPHSEHVGQTGIAISPNLYIAIGISGAIQHLAGVSSSKTIVVINKDPEAPFFKAADYGIVGDAFDVVPKLIESLKKFKSVHA